MKRIDKIAILEKISSGEMSVQDIDHVFVFTEDEAGQIYCDGIPAQFVIDTTPPPHHYRHDYSGLSIGTLQRIIDELK